MTTTATGSENRLKIYLADHLALMVGEAELAERCRRSNDGGPLGEFLSRLQEEVARQRDVLKDALRRLGGRESLLKDGGAWLAEKLGRLKLNDSLLSYSSLSRVIELEALSAFAFDRVVLWDNLDAISAGHARLAGITASELKRQSQEQLAELDEHRRQSVALAF